MALLVGASEPPTMDVHIERRGPKHQMVGLTDTQQVADTGQCGDERFAIVRVIDAHLYVDDRFRCETWNGSGSDVVDPAGKRPEGRCDSDAFGLESLRPLRLVVDDFDQPRLTAPHEHLIQARSKGTLVWI